MAEKVIHLPDELHARAKEYCKKNGFKMKDWAAKVLSISIDHPELLEGRVPRKKRLITTEGETTHGSSGPSPYELPPFWKREQGGEQEDQRQGTQANKAGVGSTEDLGARADAEVA